MRSAAPQTIASTAAGMIALLLASGVSQPAEAAFVQYASRATFDALGPFVAVDWGIFGPTGTNISTPDSRIVGGITVGVGSSQGQLFRLDEGSGFTGTFAIGDHLLADGGSQSDTFIVRFGAPVWGFGTQIDAHYISGLFTGNIDVYSAANALLYTANFSGDNTLAQDNSAPFVGVTSSLKDISYARFFVDQTDPALPAKAGALAINRLDVRVPEPSTFALLASAILGFLGLGFLRREIA